MKCLLVPLGEFGDHHKGYSGCIWCALNIRCVKFHPTEGRSLLFREDCNFIDTRYVITRLNAALKKGKTMALDKDQKTFIRKKVKQLGSMEKVKELYNKKCAVDDYARRTAERMFDENKKD